MSLLHSLQQIVTASADARDIAHHSYDWWPVAAKWRQQGQQPHAPDMIAYPDTTAQVAAVLRWAAAHGVPVTPWGAGSSVTGASLPLTGGLTLDLSRLCRIVSLDRHNLMVTAEAGVMGHDLEAALNAQGLTLNHAPQSLHRSTAGGWVATRATGQLSSRYGGIEDLVVALTIVMPSSEIIRTKATPRAAIGPDLRHLFIGSEGTLGVVTEVTLRVFPRAAARHLEAVQFPNVASGVHMMREMMQMGLRPSLVRFYDVDEARHAMRDNDFGACVMFLGFEGVPAVAEAEYMTAAALWARDGGLSLGAAPVEAWLTRRFDFSTIEQHLAQPGGVAETIEVAHFWDGILTTYAQLKASLAPLATEVLGHFSHVYPHGSSLYMILLGEAADAAAAEARIRKIWDVSMAVCLHTGAALSHHHGVGLARLPYLAQELGSTQQVLRALKAACDPQRVLSPGKLGL